MKKIAILGEFDPLRESHAATARAIGHSTRALGVAAEADWVPTPDISEDLFDRFQGIWLAPGCLYKDQAKILQAIRFAREKGVPCLGTCAGFQQIVLEYARNVLGFADAQSEEYDPGSSHLFITPLACSLRGREMQLRLSAGSMIARLYRDLEATERYTCSLGVNPVFIGDLKGGALRITGGDAEGEARVVELPGHTFFLGTLFVPQLASQPDQPHPVVSGFVSML
jgi:CTP synthase (UTP-ammonia lyase)